MIRHQALKERLSAVNYLKNYVIQFQKYELSAWLRDREKALLVELGLDFTFKNTLTQVNSYQYHYIIELLDEFAKNDKYRLNEASNIKEEIKKNCLDIIRQEKLDQLFGDSDLS
jgi:hypothetical protein